jgi:hypothetical protein
MRWSYGAVSAASTTVEHTDGSATTYIKRERPHLMFDPMDGRPTLLFTAMMDIDVNKPVPPHCTWANHGNQSVGYCDPAFTSVQHIGVKTDDEWAGLHRSKAPRADNIGGATARRMPLKTDDALEVVASDNVLVRPWGENTLRVQIAPTGWALSDELPTAYLPGGAPGFGSTGFGSALPQINAGPVTSGNIKAEMGASGLLTITRTSDWKVLFKETARTFNTKNASADSRVTFDFASSATKVYGMGQNRHQQNGAGLGLNVLGQTYSFQACMGEEGGPSNSLPWALGANPAGGGFVWGVLFNSPALGGVVYGRSNMTWSIIAEGSPVGVGTQQLRKQFDFLITTHAAGAKPEEKPFQMMEKYVDAVGHARKMPWPGYWHSKNRYANQTQLLAAARGFHSRSIPVDVIVIDW